MFIICLAHHVVAIILLFLLVTSCEYLLNSFHHADILFSYSFESTVLFGVFVKNPIFLFLSVPFIFHCSIFMFLSQFYVLPMQHVIFVHYFCVRRTSLP